MTLCLLNRRRTGGDIYLSGLVAAHRERWCGQTGEGRWRKLLSYCIQLALVLRARGAALVRPRFARQFGRTRTAPKGSRRVLAVACLCAPRVALAARQCSGRQAAHCVPPRLGRGACRRLLESAPAPSQGRAPPGPAYAPTAPLIGRPLIVRPARAQVQLGSRRAAQPPATPARPAQARAAATSRRSYQVVGPGRARFRPGRRQARPAACAEAHLGRLRHCQVGSPLPPRRQDWRPAHISRWAHGPTGAPDLHPGAPCQ